MNLLQLSKDIIPMTEELLIFKKQSTPEEYTQMTDNVIEKTKKEMVNYVLELLKVYDIHDVTIPEEERQRIKDEISKALANLTKEEAINSAIEFKQLIKEQDEKLNDTFFHRFMNVVLEIFDPIAKIVNPYHKDIKKILKG